MMLMGHESTADLTQSIKVLSTSPSESILPRYFLVILELFSGSRIKTSGQVELQFPHMMHSSCFICTFMTFTKNNQMSLL